VQQNDCGPVGRAGFGIADIQQASVDLLERREGGRRVGPGKPRQAELRNRRRRSRYAKQAAAVNACVSLDLTHGYPPLTWAASGKSWVRSPPLPAQLGDTVVVFVERGDVVVRRVAR
jgi:hypothetical protein